MSVPSHRLSPQLEQLENKAREDAMRTVESLRARMDLLYGANVLPNLSGDRVATARFGATMLGTDLKETKFPASDCVEFTFSHIAAGHLCR